WGLFGCDDGEHLTARRGRPPPSPTADAWTRYRRGVPRLNAARAPVRSDVRNQLQLRGLATRICAGWGPVRSRLAWLWLCELCHLLGLEQFLVVLFCL